MARVLGRVLLMPKGDYVETEPYEPLDMVRHNNKSWVCKSPCTGEEPSEESPNWQLMTVDGKYGEDGRGITDVSETIAGNVHSYSMKFDKPFPDGSTAFNWTITDGTGGDMYKRIYDSNNNDVVDLAEELIDWDTKAKADTALLTKFSDDGTGLKYKNAPIGGKVDIDNRTIVEDTASGALKVPIDNTSIKVVNNKLKTTGGILIDRADLDSLPDEERANNVYDIYNDKDDSITIDTVISAGSNNPIANSAVAPYVAKVGEANITGVAPTLSDAVVNLNNKLGNKLVYQDFPIRGENDPAAQLAKNIGKRILYKDTNIVKEGYIPVSICAYAPAYGSLYRYDLSLADNATARMGLYLVETTSNEYSVTARVTYLKI